MTTQNRPPHNEVAEQELLRAGFMVRVMLMDGRDWATLPSGLVVVSSGETLEQSIYVDGLSVRAGAYKGFMPWGKFCIMCKRQGTAFTDKVLLDNGETISYLKVEGQTVTDSPIGQVDLMVIGDTSWVDRIPVNSRVTYNLRGGNRHGKRG